MTNGLGGYASGPVAGAATRRYHGWFVPNLSEPRGRHVLLPRLDDSVVSDEGAWQLGAHLAQFRLEGTLPVWRFELPGRVIERRVVMPHGRHAVVVRWQLVEGAPCRLLLRPFIAARRQDAALQPDELPAWQARTVAGGGLQVALGCGGADLQLQPLAPGAAFTADPLIDRHCHFSMEAERGYDHTEHQHSPGHWTLQLAAGQAVALQATMAGDAPLAEPQALLQAERDRQLLLLATAGLAEQEEDIEARLVLAADAFIVQPGSRAEEADGSFRSVMAGYHWFNDWGRDTMISLEGLTLCTGRHAEARAILHTFAGYIRDGLLPNLFPEGGRQALYHTVDATLWFFHALDRYTLRSGDDTLVPELFPALREVIRHHVRGTHYGIGMDPQDGLLRAAADGYQLTWMDAKMDGWVVTPRRGKPVEIQALWFNALRLMAAWAQRFEQPDDGFDDLADRTGTSFNRRFWSAPHGHLLDVVDGPDPAAPDDASLRPNQVFSLSLTYPVLERRHWPAVLQAVRAELLTPMGLRTLGPREPAYRPHYQGDLRSRDGAYHQGTVWPWLLGHFVDGWLRAHGDVPAARGFLDALPAHLRQAGIGQVSEVFDAQAPHHPGGCIAQAWSVAELLRAWQATRPTACLDNLPEEEADHG
ncbi:amylo-alpha-1,6-glucosidase [Aquincola sp. J276]|uniref:amylo-alpha-1,6-glucosidase n=1 Tax=Aquincola sp. J276 TaxID=2898432 RepID=UPI0021509224|nr:amylo-alpha-1,6-glucosidase [Aquincola sp. J276]MCR5867233.1 amylo-alpha-1,6-glucosidase [Aquincola sp. J276]